MTPTSRSGWRASTRTARSSKTPPPTERAPRSGEGSGRGTAGAGSPGCYTPARNTDLDHVVAFPHGPTEPANLVCLCRTHHGFKHHGGWTLRLAADGTATRRAPDGRSWVTEPRPHGIREDLRLTADLDADRLHDIGRGWLPGLPVGMTPADLITAERCLPDDPPESPHTPVAPPDWAALDDTGSDPAGQGTKNPATQSPATQSPATQTPATSTRSKPQPSKVTSRVCWPGRLTLAARLPSPLCMTICPWPRIGNCLYVDGSARLFGGLSAVRQRGEPCRSLGAASLPACVIPSHQNDDTRTLTEVERAELIQLLRGGSWRVLGGVPRG